MTLILGRFFDGETNRCCEHEQEGFDQIVGLPDDVTPTCGSDFCGSGTNLADFRGAVPASGGGFGAGWLSAPAYLDRRHVEWRTTPAEAVRDTVFTWIGGSQVRPYRPSFPYATATLHVDGVARLRFPLGWINPYSVVVDGFVFMFEPRRFQSLVEAPHRNWDAHGVSGFYRLQVPAKFLTPGKPVTLRVSIDDAPKNCESFFYLSPRRDALRVNLTTLRNEVARLQTDLVQLRASHEMLYAHLYPELFPNRIRGQRVIVHQDPLLHYHPATITVLRDGEVIITAREGFDHLSPDGRIVLFRSRDGGVTWGGKELLYDMGNSDHRCAPIFELPNGDWLTTDYRAGSEYNDQGVWDIEHMTGPTLWGGWSTDHGKTWSFTDEPMTVPGMHPYAEVERHMIQLPSGRLLVTANAMLLGDDGVHPKPHAYRFAVFASDDNGRHWRVFSRLPDPPFQVEGECTMLRTKSGRILLLARSQPAGGTDYTQRGALMQSVSLDDGATWSPFEPTAMSSMASPGHLLQLRDGRILCTHASRHHPGSIYVTTSDDEGKSWNTDRTRIVTMDIQNFDSCYPNTGQLADGTLLTTWYANLFGKFYIALLRYTPDQV